MSNEPIPSTPPFNWVEFVRQNEPLFNVESVELYFAKDNHIISVKADPQLLEAYISHMRLAHKGVKLKKNPRTQDEIEYKKAYNHIYNRVRTIKAGL